MLTLKKLKSMKPDFVFARGVIDNPKLCREKAKWVAVRGDKPDWAIYYSPAKYFWDLVKNCGAKCSTEEVIRDLVPCDDEAYKLYRF